MTTHFYDLFIYCSCMLDFKLSSKVISMEIGVDWPMRKCDYA